MKRLGLFTLSLAAVAIVNGVALYRTRAAEPTSAGIDFFERKIRPLLIENCCSCHGEEKQKGHLRLDSPAAILTGGEGGTIIVAGEPEKSRLILAVSYQDEDLKMPPKKRLAQQQVSDLTTWIKMGAPMPAVDVSAAPSAQRKEFQIAEKDRAHWAFQPVKRPPLPGVKDKKWGASPIDAFILSKLEGKGLAPNPPATKRELIRRAYYDLTGLPPSIAELEAFLRDTSPDAYEQMIDRLLESPRYGEKWGRHWLDLVRFAESNSYERDGAKPHAWRYRDYVIRSFNSDKPYDRFIREQLAGDELPDSNAESIIATGFYRLGIWDDEPADRELARYDGLDDIVTTTGQVFLGLTVDCARCHNHKLDPIPQRDYYRLVSFFQNINHYRNGGPTDEVLLFNDPSEKAAYEKRVRQLERERDALQATLTATEKIFLARIAKSEPAERSDLDDLEFRYYRDTWEKLPDFSQLKAENSGKVPSRLFDVSLRSRDTAFGFVFEGVLVVPQADEYTFFLDSDDGARLTIDAKEVVVYDGIHGTGREQKAATHLRQGRLPIKLEYFQREHGLGLSVAWSGPGFERRTLSMLAGASGEQLSRKDIDRLIKESAQVLGKDRVDEYEKQKQELQRLKKEKVAADVALAVTERGTEAPETFILVRGNPGVKGEKVEPGFLEVLSPAAPRMISPIPNAKTSGRRTVLADWITSPQNQLTARVMVNRIWQYHFGRGIVRSPNNFGVQGDKPTHPELLDWLASEFMAQGWRLKSLHRLIMTSNAYRMSSHGRSEALEADPTNDLLWRFDIRRLSAEELRDTILALSDTLNLKMFGPGVFVNIPKEVMAGQSQPGLGWGKSPPDEQARRSIYIHVKRSLLTPILESFDFAETDRSTPIRFATIQPTQALGMLNGDFLNRQAELCAERLRRDAGTELKSQVRLGLYLATARPPNDAEIARGLRLIETLQRQDGASQDVALKYFCLMMLNLNEMIYLD